VGAENISQTYLENVMKALQKFFVQQNGAQLIGWGEPSSVNAGLAQDG
jgi:hypothetical protein